MKFDIRNRWTGAVQVSAEITCDENAAPSIKLGLAIRWARENGASLVGASLVGARLDGARLDGARLDGASLVGARLDGARLVGASLDGARLDRARLVGASLVGARLDGALICDPNKGAVPVERLVARVTREDGYAFYLWLLKSGEHLIKAGCRSFTIDRYRQHVADEYPDTAKALETLAILGFFERRLADIVPTKVAEPVA